MKILKHSILRKFIIIGLFTSCCVTESSLVNVKASWSECMPSYLCDKCESDYIDDKHLRIELNQNIMNEVGIPVSEHTTIPEVINYKGKTYTVVGIDSSCFEKNKYLKSVNLPSTITYIGPYAFNECVSLESINLPPGLKGIGLAAFQCCYKLKNINFPESLEYIGGFGFNHCYNVECESLYIPSKIKQIGEDVNYPAHMFYDFSTRDFKEFIVSKDNKCYTSENGCLYNYDKTLLVSVPRGKIFDDNTYVMPDSITSLGELAFGRNENLEKIIIGDNLIIDGDMDYDEFRFYNNYGNNLAVACYIYSGVKEYDVKPSNLNYNAVNGILYTKDMKSVIAVPNKYTGVIDIPEGVKTWKSQAIWTGLEYSNNLAISKIQEIRFPSTIEEIDDQQMEVINDLVVNNSVKLYINEDNRFFEISESGRLRRKDNSGKTLYYTVCSLNRREEPVNGKISDVKRPNSAIWIEKIVNGWGQDVDGKWVKMAYLTQ